jgi:hypothetical protein
MIRRAVVSLLLVAATAFLTAGCGPINPGAVSGFVLDQVTNDGIGDVLVSSGSEMITTDSDGRYLLTLGAGRHTVSYARVGYVSDTKEYNLTAGSTLMRDVELLPQLQVGTITIKLEWDDSEVNLDGLWTPPGDRHVLPGDNGETPLSRGFSETIQITDPLSAGTYSYSVSKSSTAHSFSGCGARVTVTAGAFQRTFTSDSVLLSRTRWNVFEIDGATRGFRLVNTYE